MPRVSIIIPSYNHDKYIHEAIQSVLDQTYQDFEIIITDDGSTDDTVREAKKFTDPRIKIYCFEKNRGSVIASRNCIANSQGEYLAMLSSDDVFYTEKLEKQIKYLDAHPDVWAVFGYAHIIDEEGNDFTDTNHFYANIFRQPNRSRHAWLNYFFYNGNCLCNPSVLARKAVYAKLAPPDPRFPQLGDWNTWIKLCLQHEIFILPEELIKFRVRKGESNASGNRPEVTSRLTWEYFHILNNYLSIIDITELTKIFPEAETRFGKDLESDLIPFYLAMLALENTSTPYQLFGMNSLFDLLQHNHIAEKLQIKHDFHYSDFIKLTARKKLHIQENFAKLYIDSGNGFNEKESMSLPVNIKVDCLEFDLKALESIKALRFDPLENYVVFTIKSIQIEDNTGMHPVNSSYYSIFQKNSMLFSENADPYLLVELEKIDKPSKIVFYLEYHFLGTEALEHLYRKRFDDSDDLSAQIIKLERLMRVKEQYAKNLEKSIYFKDQHIRNYENIINLKDDHIRNLGNVVNLKDEHIRNMNTVISNMEHTIGWKLQLFYYRLRDGILPAGSWRRRAAKRVFNTVKTFGRIISFKSR